MDWAALVDREPPEREWAIEHWLGMGYTTLLVGQGGIGKTLIAQQLASALATGISFLSEVRKPRTVLMWCCEDDHDELWRRQRAIARWLGASLDDFVGRLIVQPRQGLDNALFSSEFGRPMWTPLIEELREQAADYCAEVVILDNVGQVFGGNENDRHHVTSFCNGIAGAAPGCATMMLAHPGRALGSEFSGSSAWENAVRMRLYLGTKLPDAKQQDEADDDDGDGVRFLAKRKSNYTGRDYHRLTFEDGVLKPGTAADNGSASEIAQLRQQRSRAVVMRGLQKLISMGVQASDQPSSPAYLPKLLLAYNLAEELTKRELGEGVRALMLHGRLKRDVVGRYANRSEKLGLVINDKAN